MRKVKVRNKTAWPTKAAMEQVYKKNLWGGVGATFYSGEGSHDPFIVDPYIQVVKLFLGSFDKPMIVCDLGCGDFNVGKELVEYTKHYVAVDIVSELIERNKSKFKMDKLEFRCMDIAREELPEGDCAILRQVLQHLSNAEIQNIVHKLSRYKYVILTEHIPAVGFEPNRDIISGQGIRLKKQSGVDIMSEPFSFKVKENKELLSFLLNDGYGKIVTSLYTLA